MTSEVRPRVSLLGITLGFGIALASITGTLIYLSIVDTADHVDLTRRDLAAHASEANGRLETIEIKLDSTDGLDDQLETIQGKLGSIDGLNDKLETIQDKPDSMDGLNNQLETIQVKLDSMDGLVEDVLARDEEIEYLNNELNGFRSALAHSEVGKVIAEQRVAHLSAERDSLSDDLARTSEIKDALQYKLDTLSRNPPLVSEPIESSGNIAPREIVSIPIYVDPLAEVRGQIICNGGACQAYIQDPSGQNVLDLGEIRQANFSFVADIGGRYSLVIRSAESSGISYEATHTVLTHYFSSAG